MKSVSRLKRLPSEMAEVRLSFDGQDIIAKAGDSVAAAVLATTIGATREMSDSGVGRAPYCMMGVCFDCLMVIDGVPNCQACMVEVQDGMVVERQIGLRHLRAEEATNA